MIPVKIILSTNEGNHFYKGFLKENNQEKIIQYQDENKDTVYISIADMEVIVERSNSTMNFNIDKTHEFNFNTEFGDLLFKLETNFLLIENNFFKVEYSLYDECDNLAYKNILLLEYIKE